MRPTLLLSTCLALALPGCELLVPSDDLVGGKRADAGTDGAPDDAGARDASTAREGGTPCASGVTFCDDFDGHGNIPWTADHSGSTTLAVTTVAAHASNVLHATRPPASGRDHATNSFPFQGTLRSCDLDVFGAPTQTVALSFFQFGYASMPGPDKSYSVSMGVGGGISEFADRGTLPQLYHDAPVPPLSSGQWVHVRIEFTWGANASARVLVDQQEIVSAFSLTPPDGATGPYLTVGMVYQSDPGAGWVLDVDNVACTID